MAINKLAQNKAPIRRKKYNKKVDFNAIQPSAKQIRLTKEIFFELKAKNPKSITNVELVANEFSKKANLPYTVAFKLATRLVYGQKMGIIKAE